MSKDIDKILSEAEEIDVGESWFKVLALPNNVYAIHELLGLKKQFCSTRVWASKTSQKWWGS
jgi:fructose 1,6-bisphosphatase